MMTTRLGCSLAVAALLSGCFTFNDERVPKVKPAKIEDKARRPSMVITTVDYEIEGINMADDWTQGTMVANALQARWKDDDLVGRTGDPGDVQDPDYTLRLVGKQDNSGSMWAAFVTGLTLFLIPSSSNIEFSIKAWLTDHRTGEEYFAEGTNSATMWQHIIFLPVTPIGLRGGIKFQTELYRYIYWQFDEQGAFKRYREPAAVGTQ